MNNDKGKLEFANKFLSTGKEKKRMNISMDDVLDRGDFWEDIKR